MPGKNIQAVWKSRRPVAEWSTLCITSTRSEPHLIYGTGPNGGFVLLTGEVGTGKTLLIRSLLAQQLSEVEIALVLNPRLSRREFIATICDELGIVYTGNPYSLKQLIDALTKHLLKTHEEGRHTVLVVDEAQNLSPRVLEQVRLLTNLETTRHKLLRIILVGQPELVHMLARKELRQVDQRITARFHLSPLERQETARYITHRLAVAGIREDLFTPAATRQIHRLSGGVPRRINTLCERVLLAIFSSGKQRAGVALVWRAARDVKGRGRKFSIWRWSVLVLLLAFLIALAYWQWPTSIRGVNEAEALQAPETDLSLESVTPSLPPLEALETTRASPGSVVEETLAITNEPPAQVKIEAAEYFDLERLFRQPQQIDQVYRLLFALWTETYRPDSTQTACAQAPRMGLRCLRDRGDWRQLETLNRPLLLRLVKQKRVRLSIRVSSAGFRRFSATMA
ncbi:MAG: AAA family ATPase [Candidatus Thiodiazotropha sp.]